jgi:predicted NBD/HSP70 family sugar kinase
MDDDLALTAFETAPPTRLGGGANQTGARAYNERLALSLIRLNGPLPKAELARLTGLSAQTLSQIIRRLEAEGLVMALEPTRGRIGQPSVPYALNPSGAHSFGVKIGRRSTDIVLCNMAGEILSRAKIAYLYPTTTDVFQFIRTHVRAMRRRLGEPRRVVGVGVAMPFEIWKWQDEVDAPAHLLDAWRTCDVESEVQRATSLPVILSNDASAACAAELLAHPQRAVSDFLYFYIGSFAGGGVVLNGQLQQGRTGNAGALGSMPVTIGGRTRQLIHFASLIALEKALRRTERDRAILQDPSADWSTLGRPLANWIDRSAQAIAQATVAGAAVIDFAEMRIDGAMPRAILTDLVAATRQALTKLDQQGLSAYTIVEGSGGPDARAVGGAMLPILANFTSDREVLLKSVPQPITA